MGWKKWLNMRSDMSLGFYSADFLFRRIFRQNAGVKWAIHHTTTIHCPERISKGVATWPGDSPGIYINASNGVHIGDFTNIGPNVGIISTNHDAVDNDCMLPSDPVRIGSFCWLGMHAIILPGVQLGDFTIVGAGAVVVKSFPEGYCVLAGNPARVIRSLNKQACDEQAKAKYSLISSS